MEWSQISTTVITSLAAALAEMRSHTSNKYAPLQKKHFLPNQYRKHHDAAIDAVVGWLHGISDSLSHCGSWVEARLVLTEIQSGRPLPAKPPTTETNRPKVTTIPVVNPSEVNHNPTKDLDSDLDKKIKNLTEELTWLLEERDAIAARTRAAPSNRSARESTYTRVNMNDQFRPRKEMSLNLRRSTPTPAESVGTTVADLPSPPQPPHPKKSVNFVDPTGDLMAGRPQFVRKVLQHLPSYTDHSSSLRRRKGEV